MMFCLKLQPVNTRNVITIQYIRFAFMFFKLCVSMFLWMIGPMSRSLGVSLRMRFRYSRFKQGAIP